MRGFQDFWKGQGSHGAGEAETARDFLAAAPLVDGVHEAVVAAPVQLLHAGHRWQPRDAVP